MMLNKSIITFIAITLLFLSGIVSYASQNETTTIDTSSTNDSTAVESSTGELKKPIYPMSPERKEKLVTYSHFKSIWRFIEFFLGIGILSLFLLTGFSAKLRNWAQIARKKFFVIWLFLALFLIAEYIISFPFDLYRYFLVEGQYGFVNQSFLEWCGEDILDLFIGMVIGIIPMWFFYWLIGRTKKWWLWFSLGSIPFIIFMVVVAPIVIAPLYNKYEPLKDKQLESEILTLASKAGIEGSDVFQVNASKQSSKINAYVTGLFGTKRIVLYDTMIDNFTSDEIKFVMGHEMGHYVKNHVWKMLFIIIIFTAFALWLTDKTIHRVIKRYKHKTRFDNLSNIASLPLVMIFISIISFLFNPVTNGYGRYIEHESDIYGMDITGVSGETAAIAFDKLSVFNLSDPDPHPIIEFWF
ncbi:MAG: M48 family metallopeptidase, partial [Candidatus Zixiibacteriota bacterium]